MSSHLDVVSVVSTLSKQISFLSAGNSITFSDPVILFVSTVSVYYWGSSLKAFH
jgi:hypothetical protein